MELRHLRYFVAVAEELHFGRAAQRLHIAQPPLSQQIGKLEDELGLKLFSRAKRRIELTHAGRVFLPEARQTLFLAERAAEAARRADRGEIGPLAVACGPIAVQTVLPSVLPVFRQRFPEVEISLTELPMAEIVEALQRGTVDLGLLLPYFDSELLEREVILRLPMRAALPRGHPLARRKSIRLKQLAKDRFILVARSLASGLYDYIVGTCQQAGFTPKVAQEATYIPTLLRMVAAGYGVSLVPKMPKPMEVQDVAFVQIQEPYPAVELCMAWRANDSSPPLAAFRNVVRAFFPES